jgi:hypothetical protein
MLAQIDNSVLLQEAQQPVLHTALCNFVQRSSAVCALQLCVCGIMGHTRSLCMCAVQVHGVLLLCADSALCCTAGCV